MKYVLLSLFLVVAPAPLLAEPFTGDLTPDRVYIPLASHHTVPPEKFGHEAWEEVNPGVILSWENVGPGNVLDLGVGVVRNSSGITSPTVSLGLVKGISEKIDLGVTGSLVYYGRGGDFSDGHVGGGVFLVPALQARYDFSFGQLIPTPDGFVGLFGLTFAIGDR